MPFLIIGALILMALIALVLTLVIRAVHFVPRKEEREKVAPIFVNNEKAVSDLAEMIKCKTISDNDKSKEDESEFEKFVALLPTLFPLVFEKCTFEQPSDRSILIKWEGKEHDAPTVLMSHYDVVSVVEEDWEKPPFEGVQENGVLWGRGTLDTKGTLNGVLQAAEALIGEGFVPQNDIYFAFAGDEEVNGHGAIAIVDLFESREITPGLVLDEGGAVVENVFPGVTAPCALIGIAEKGLVNIEYTIKGGGGHASSPAAHTPVGKLAAACVKVENTPFEFGISKPALALFDTVGRHSTFVYRLIFANLWLFKPVLNMITKKSGGELNALVRTSTAFTQMEGSKGMNVIPPFARMVSNHRIKEGETPETVAQRIREIIDDPDINVSIVDGAMAPSVISDTNCEAWERVKCVVGDTWQEAIVSPYLMLACSDSRHWGRISDKVYRFSAMALSKEERGTIHGNNERSPYSTIIKTVEFYIRLMKKS